MTTEERFPELTLEIKRWEENLAREPKTYCRGNERLLYEFKDLLACYEVLEKCVSKIKGSKFIHRSLNRDISKAFDGSPKL